MKRVKSYNSYIKESWINQEQGVKEFSVIKVMTKTGEKISMCYTSEVKEHGVSLQDNLDFIAAVSLVPTFSKELGLTEFDSASDEIIGVIPNFMITKKPKATSYVDTLGIDACCDDYVEIELEIGIPIDEDFKAKRNPEHLKRKEDILAKINSLENILDTKLKNGVELKEEELDRITLQVESLKLRFEKMK